MERVYIVIFGDNTIMLLPNKPDQKSFNKGAVCYSTLSVSIIDNVREFVSMYFKMGADFKYKSFNKEW